MANTKWYRFYLINPSRQIHYFAMFTIDEGGSGKVWSGVSGNGVPVAIKIIKPTSNVAQDITTWITEQNICLKCLEHPHIVTTYDQFCSNDGNLVLIMEKAGGSLEDLINNGKAVDPLAVCMIGTQILSALHHIHGLGVIHRDVTLKNILWFPAGIFKLADFGISKQCASVQEMARTLTIPRFMYQP